MLKTAGKSGCIKLKRSLSRMVAGALLLFLPGFVAEASADSSSSVNENVQADKKVVSGRILDEKGEPIPGAAVYEKGDTSNGVVSDFDGNYSLTVTDNTIIVVNFIGFEVEEIAVAGKSQITIILKEEMAFLEEVIVTGFQAIPRYRATGSAVVVNKEKLEKIQGTTLNSKLEGTVTGLSSFGGLSIRGVSSFAVGSAPLFVVDGQPVIGSSLNDLNPDDIDNITVLKDAAATSLYGVRASNGVIVVTTKRGTTAKPKVNMSAGFYIDPLPSQSYQKWASTSDIVDYEQEYLLGNPTYQANPQGYFDNLNSFDAPKTLTKMDWLYYQLANGQIAQSDVDQQINLMRNNDYRKEYRDKFGQMKITQDYNMSISKGDENSNMFFSARYENNGSYSRDNQSDKMSFYLKNEINMTKWLNVIYGANASLGNQTGYNSSYWGETTFMPYETLYNQDGTLNYMYGYNKFHADRIAATPGLNFMGYNPIEEIKLNKNSTNSVYWKLFANANVKFSDDLNLELKYQHEDMRQSNEQFDDATSYKMRHLINQFASTKAGGGYDYFIPQGGHLKEINSRGSYYNFRTQLNFNKTVDDVHGITALVGGEIRQDKSRLSIGERYGYDDNKLTYKQVNWNTLSQSGVVGQLSSNSQRIGEALNVQEVMHRYVSAYFNGGYTYDSRYSLNGSVRVEQADLFGTDPKYRYRPLWSVGGSWNISNEEFLKDIAAIDVLKVRVTYGITGNVDQNSSPFLLARYITSPYSNAGLTDIITPPNRLLRWEKTSTFNAGFDLGLIKKMNLSFDIYDKLSSDLLANKSFDPSTGFLEGRMNNGEMRNRGAELMISYNWVKNSDWNVMTAFTASYNKNTIEKVGYIPTDALDMMRYPTAYYLKGDAFNSLYAYRYAGLTADGNPSVYDADGNIVANQPVRNINALVAVGQLTPKWNGAFDLSVRWKSLDLFAKIIYYAGHSMRTDVTPLYSGVSGGDMHKDIVNRWTPANTNTNIPSMSVYGMTGERNYHWRNADINTESASFVKMRNIGLAYTLSSYWLKGVGMERVSLRAQVNNPFYWAANKSDIDPEAYNLNLGTRTAAQEPTYVFGVNVNF